MSIETTFKFGADYFSSQLNYANGQKVALYIVKINL